MSAALSPAIHPRVVELLAEQTHHLRKSVLRDGTPTQSVTFDGDDDPETFHLGVEIDGRTGGVIVATSTWMQQGYADRSALFGYQLRGMASAPAQRGSGLGLMLLNAGIERCRNVGAAIVWARARDEALGFYERFGFVVVGEGYVDLATGLAHHDMIYEVKPS